MKGISADSIQEFAKKSEEASELLSLLANPNRLRILCELLDGERSVSALEDVVGLSQSALSQHLARLRDGGIVTTRREAQTIHYSIFDKRAERVLAVLAEIFCKSKDTRRPSSRK